jgi:hypothetical protein
MADYWQQPKRWKRWCGNHKTWMLDDLKYVIWSDESPFTLFPTSGWVYVLRMSKEACNPECLVLTEIWRWICDCQWLHGCGHFREPASSFGSVVFPNNHAIFQADSLPKHTAGIFQFWNSMKKHFHIFPSQHSRQTSVTLRPCGQV